MGRRTRQLAGHPRLIDGWVVAGPWAQGRKGTGWAQEISSLCFSPDGRTLASAGGENRIRVWDVNSGDELLHNSAQICPTSSIVFSPDSATLITGSMNGNLIFWDPRSGTERRRIAAHQTPIMGLTISPDGATLLTESQNGPAKFWDVLTGKMLRQVQLPRDHGENALEFSPDGRMILTGGPPHRLIDVVACRERAQLPRDEADNAARPTSVKFVPGRPSLIASYGAYLLECFVATGRTIRRIEKPWVKNHGYGASLAISPDGSHIVTGDQDENARLLDFETGKEAGRFVAPGAKGIALLAFSPDGRLIAASSDRSLWLWNVTSGRLLQTLVQIHRGEIKSLTFSPDAKLLASASDDSTVLVWEVAELVRRPAE
jgi:WD40 repeat protein